MNELMERIKQEAVIKNETIVKVDTFLNHQIDASLMDRVGEEFYKYFKDKPITKVITIESSGIAPAVACALRFKVPCIFIKKTKPSTMLNPLSADVFSFTKNTKYTMFLDGALLNEDDQILFIDDFLANGEAFLGFEKIMQEANVNIVGVGIVIEKSFQKGRSTIEKKGYEIYSLARISSLKDNIIKFK